MDNNNNNNNNNFCQAGTDGSDVVSHVPPAHGAAPTLQQMTLPPPAVTIPQPALLQQQQQQQQQKQSLLLDGQLFQNLLALSPVQQSPATCQGNELSSHDPRLSIPVFSPNLLNSQQKQQQQQPQEQVNLENQSVVSNDTGALARLAQLLAAHTGNVGNNADATNAVKEVVSFTKTTNEEGVKADVNFMSIMHDPMEIDVNMNVPSNETAVEEEDSDDENMYRGEVFIPQPKPEKELEPKKVLGVYGLKRTLKESDLESKFSRFGKLDEVMLIRTPNVSHNYGFVFFNKLEDAMTAKEATDHSIWGGRSIVVIYSPKSKQFTRIHIPSYVFKLDAQRNDESNRIYLFKRRVERDSDGEFTTSKFDSRKKTYRGREKRDYDDHDSKYERSPSVDSSSSEKDVETAKQRDLQPRGKVKSSDRVGDSRRTRRVSRSRSRSRSRDRGHPSRSIRKRSRSRSRSRSPRRYGRDRDRRDRYRSPSVDRHRGREDRRHNPRDNETRITTKPSVRGNDNGHSRRPRSRSPARRRSWSRSRDAGERRARSRSRERVRVAGKKNLVRGRSRSRSRTRIDNRKRP